MIVVDVIRKAMLASLGVQERVNEFIDEMIKKGELSQGEGAKLMKEWMDKAAESSKGLTDQIAEAVAKALDRVPIATKADVEKIEKRLETLSTHIQKMEGGES